MSTPHGAERAGRDAVFNIAGGGTAGNAIELLQSDHRQVEAWFVQFQHTDDISRKEQLVWDICRALEVHMRIEEEIFYPAFLDETGNEALHHQAIVEHEGVRELIRKILVSPGVAVDHYLAARMAVLAGMVELHVAEEEEPGGMFDLAAASGLDLDALGARIEKRKLALMDDADT